MTKRKQAKRRKNKVRGFSKAIIAGNLTRDPELRTTPGGANVCSFSIAVNRNYRDASGNNQESVSFIDCSAWGKLGETISQYKKKGDGILVSGRLEQRSWDDKSTGQKRSRVEVVVDDCNFIGERGAAGASDSTMSGVAADVVPDDVPTDDAIDLSEVPF